MLITEWNTEEAKKVWYEEAREQERENIAKTALAEGLPIDIIQKLTGFDTETIQSLSAQV